MLDRQSKKMLRYLTSKKHNPDGYMMFHEFYTSYSEFARITEHQTMACMRHLEQRGFIQYGENQYGDTVGLELEHTAYQHFAFSRMAVLSFVGKSIIIPILITLLTLITVNLAKDALPVWLKHLLL